MPASSPASSLASCPTSVARPLRVLLAEDDDDLRAALVASLRRGGHQVHEVPDGAALLERVMRSLLAGANETPPDVIVTDVRLPAVHGLGVVEGLRAEGCAVPVIVISAFGDADLRRRVEALPEVSFLPKPFEPEELEREIERLLPVL